MTPDKIEKSDIIPGLASVDMRIDKDNQQKQQNSQHKNKKKKMPKNIEDVIEEENQNGIEEGHVDFHA